MASSFFSLAFLLFPAFLPSISSSSQERHKHAQATWACGAAGAWWGWRAVGWGSEAWFLVPVVPLADCVAFSKSHAFCGARSPSLEKEKDQLGGLIGPFQLLYTVILRKRESGKVGSLWGLGFRILSEWASPDCSMSVYYSSISARGIIFWAAATGTASEEFCSTSLPRFGPADHKRSTLHGYCGSPVTVLFRWPHRLRCCHALPCFLLQPRWPCYSWTCWAHFRRRAFALAMLSAWKAVPAMWLRILLLILFRLPWSPNGRCQPCPLSYYYVFNLLYLDFVFCFFL